MGAFDSILKDNQTIFSNPDALDPDFVPKLLPHREDQQKHVATCIKPLFLGRHGQNLLIKGTSGIGKTACIKRVLLDLEEETDEITSVYINCWTKNTTYKILTSVANSLGYKFTHNMSTDELMKKIEELSKKYKGIVYVFDEIDKADDFDFIYFLLEDLCKKVIILITADFTWHADLDPRIMSRLLPDVVTFNPYDLKETSDILQERIKYAFYQVVWSEEAFTKLASRASKYHDIRIGIQLLKAAGVAAENDSSKHVLEKHADEAIKQTDEIKIKTSSEVTDEEKAILELCKDNTESLASDLFSIYQSTGGDKSEKTFRRRLARLASRGLIDLQETTVSTGGVSTKVIYKGFARTLDEFG